MFILYIFQGSGVLCSSFALSPIYDLPVLGDVLFRTQGTHFLQYFYGWHFAGQADEGEGGGGAEPGPAGGLPRAQALGETHLPTAV